MWNKLISSRRMILSTAIVLFATGMFSSNQLVSARSVSSAAGGEDSCGAIKGILDTIAKQQLYQSSATATQKGDYLTLVFVLISGRVFILN